MAGAKVFAENTVAAHARAHTAGATLEPRQIDSIVSMLKNKLSELIRGAENGVIAGYNIIGAQMIIHEK